MASGHFRRDVYYRLNEYHIHIPPLKRRPKDIRALANHFLKLHAKKNGKDIVRVSPKLLDVLQSYTFPGNVRELENIISSAVLIETERELSLASARSLISFSGNQISAKQGFPTLAEVQMNHIRQALKLTGDNRTHAAKLLGIGLRTLQRKLKSADIQDGGTAKSHRGTP